MADLTGKRVAILATDGFEFDELTLPNKAMEDAGAKSTVVSIHPGEIKGWKSGLWTQSIQVDMTIEVAKADMFDALLIPGGVMSPDKLRMNPLAVDFVKAFVHAAKSVGAICHGPWMLVEANEVRGRRMTSWPSIKTDLINAGAEWMDQAVVSDNGLVTSRKPDDIPEFSAKLLEVIAGGVHARQSAESRATLR